MPRLAATRNRSAAEHRRPRIGRAPEESYGAAPVCQRTAIAGSGSFLRMTRRRWRAGAVGVHVMSAAGWVRTIIPRKRFGMRLTEPAAGRGRRPSPSAPRSIEPSTNRAATVRERQGAGPSTNRVATGQGAGPLTNRAATVREGPLTNRAATVRERGGGAPSLVAPAPWSRLCSVRGASGAAARLRAPISKATSRLIATTLRQRSLATTRGEPRFAPAGLALRRRCDGADVVSSQRRLTCCADAKGG